MEKYKNLKNKERYFNDIVLFAREVLGRNLFDYEVSSLKRFDERVNTNWYHQRHRPADAVRDYQRFIYQEWNKLRNIVDGGNRSTELPYDLSYTAYEPQKKVI